jgi:hypothetical protein
MTRPMQLDLAGAPDVLTSLGVEVGDVDPITGGRGGARFSVVVGIVGETAYELKFWPDGTIYGVGQSGLHYLRRRTKLGRVRELPPMVVDWLVEPPAEPPRCCCGCGR